jgi:hypothetical protein
LIVGVAKDMAVGRCIYESENNMMLIILYNIYEKYVKNIIFSEEK